MSMGVCKCRCACVCDNEQLSLVPVVCVSVRVLVLLWAYLCMDVRVTVRVRLIVGNCRPTCEPVYVDVWHMSVSPRVTVVVCHPIVGHPTSLRKMSALRGRDSDLLYAQH